MNKLIPTTDFLLVILLASVPVIVFLVLISLTVRLLFRSQLSEPTKNAITRWSLVFIASISFGLVGLVIWVLWPEIPHPSEKPRPTRIDNMQELAGLLFSQYDTGKPICIIPVTNLANTYLLLFSGTELKAPTHATHITSDVLAALSITVFDSFKDSAKDALRDFWLPNGRGLEGANLIVAGHSLGGMEAENLVADGTFAKRYRIIRLITFGKPKTQAFVSDSKVSRHFLLSGDPVVKWINRFLFFIREHSPGTVTLPPTANSSQSEHSNYSVSDALKGYDSMGDPVLPGQTGAFLLLDLPHSACFRADNPKIYCTPQVHTYGCNPV